MESIATACLCVLDQFDDRFAIVRGIRDIGDGAYKKILPPIKKEGREMPFLHRQILNGARFARLDIWERNFG